MPANRDWTVVTVAYNSVDQLQRHWAARDRGYVWIVVDNGSTDASPSFLSRHADLVLSRPDNPGFAVANNLALAHVDTPYVAFVNPDVQLTRDGWQPLLAQTISTTGGLVGPQLVNPDGTDQANARGIPYLGAKVCHRVVPEQAARAGYARSGLDTPTYCSWLMGAAVAGATDTVRELGGWCEDYFLYYEDHDLGLRAWRAGRSVTIDPRVRWTHDWGRATTRLDRAAWSAEARSMRTFYRAYPELLSRTMGRRHQELALRRHGLGRMCDLIWTPTEAEAGAEVRSAS